MTPKITLEQWQTFRCVVDEGSFARAAEALNKSQSSISYAIGQLNAQLPQPVLRIEGRRSVLTEAGKVLYRHAEQLLKQASDAEAVARSLAMGFESEVTIAIDSLQDVGALASSFARFSDQFPHTRVRVRRHDASDIEPQILKEPYPVPRPRQDVREHGAPPDRLEGLADCDHEVIGALQPPALR